MILKELFESKEIMTVTAKPINRITRKRIERLQDLFKNIDASFRREKLDVENIEELIGYFEQADLPFLKRPIAQLKDALSQFEKAEAAKSRNTPEFKAKRKQQADDWETAFLAGEFDNADTIGEVLLDLFDGSESIGYNLDKETKDIMKYAFTVGQGLFSSSDIEITPATYKQIANINLDEYRYSYVEFPHSKLNSLAFTITYILNLTNGPNPKRITSNTDLRKHSAQANANSAGHDNLMAMVDDYLHNNRKALIPKIMQELQKFPELVKANNKAKAKIKKVYRGIPESDDGMTEREILSQDRENKYVATSDRRSAAMNFAMRKGHMERDARVDSGYLITYDPTNAIVLVTSILGTVYGESEIIIDATKAGVIDIEHEYFDRGD